MENHGLEVSKLEKQIIFAFLNKYIPNTGVWAYGSRVNGQSKSSSDLDLVVFASEEQLEQVSALREAFEESNLPFRVDLFVWDNLSDAFKKAIKKKYVVLVS